MKFEQAVRNCPALAEAFQRGLQALKAAEKHYVVARTRAGWQAAWTWIPLCAGNSRTPRAGITPSASAAISAKTA